MKTVFHWTVETWWIVVLRRDVQYFLRAYEFDAKIICVVILCKFCEEFFIKIFVFSTVIILFPMASNVLQPGKITTKKANRCASFYKMPSESEKCRRVLQIWKHLNAVGERYKINFGVINRLRLYFHSI